MPTGNTWAISGALRQSLANSNRNTVCNTHANSNTAAYSYSHGNTHCYSDGYGNSYSYSTANAHAEDHADPEKSSNSAAEIQSLISD
jgi:hypothetical protein